MKILGISAFYHDSAAALIEDGRIVAAAQEERFTRKKGDEGFPKNAINYCLGLRGLLPSELDAVVFYDKPIVTFERLLSSYLHRAPKGLTSFLKAVPLWLRKKLWIEDEIKKSLAGVTTVLFSRHHMSHAASAFYPSPYESAAILTVDGVGEWDTCTIGKGQGGQISLLKSVKFPHSLGLFYSAFTYYCGFKVNSGEYKLMGLAPYGDPRYVSLIKDKLIELKTDGSFKLNERYFDYISGLRMVNKKFENLFGLPALAQGATPTKHYMDVAASVQRVLEDALIALAKEARKVTEERYLVMAGGVALNSVANYKIAKEAGFAGVWIQPAAGDSGAAVGAALYAAHALFGIKRNTNHMALAGQSDKSELCGDFFDGMQGSFLGPEYSETEAVAELNSVGARFERLEDNTLFARTAEALDKGMVVGWFQGRMEFGPRALGARSILGDPRNPDMQRIMNMKIKFREGFRPFAPAVLAERACEYFDIAFPSPYMLHVCPLESSHQFSPPHDEPEGFERLKIKRSDIPAVTHVDYSARLQTVHKGSNQRFHRLLCEWDRLTGCPVLINTSFNVRGEPIVLRPIEAYRCFLGTGIDVLVVGNLFLEKGRQDINQGSDELITSWRASHVLD